jgi:hypothetical protein
MRGTIVWCSSLVAAAVLSLAPLTPAIADTPTASTPCVLDATHFVVVRGDRIVVYEVDPKKGYDLRVLNSALVDDGGHIVGQFRPETEPAAVTPAPAPEPPASAPVPLPYSAMRRADPAPRARVKLVPGVATPRRGAGPTVRAKLASAH